MIFPRYNHIRLVLTKNQLMSPLHYSFSSSTSHLPKKNEKRNASAEKLSYLSTREKKKKREKKLKWGHSPHYF